jgi:hypothetical protein
MNGETGMKRARVELEAERAKVEAAIGAIRAAGLVLLGVRLEKAAAGGSAGKKSQGDYKYGRLRAGRGKELDNGNRSQYVPLEEIPGVEAAIGRGKAVAKLQRRLEKLNEILGDAQ